jgi:hypothetical protein
MTRDPIPLREDFRALHDEALLLLAAKTIGYARAVLARYGTPRPIPVTERLPGAEDCCINPRTKQGLPEWCWGWTGAVPGVPYAGRWRMMGRSALPDEATHWLPAHALPLPEVQE